MDRNHSTPSVTPNEPILRIAEASARSAFAFNRDPHSFSANLDFSDIDFNSPLTFPLFRLNAPRGRMWPRMRLSSAAQNTAGERAGRYRGFWNFPPGGINSLSNWRSQSLFRPNP